MVLVIFLGGTAIFTVLALAIRSYRTRKFEGDIFFLDIVISSGLGVLLALNIYPTYLITRRFEEQHGQLFVVKHGKLVSTAFKDIDPNYLVIAMMLGTGFSTIWALIQFFQRVSEKD